MERVRSKPGGDFEWSLLLEKASHRSFSAICHSIPDRRVLITGAGGSIGSALARSVSALAPEHLVLLENSENALYKLDRDFRTSAFTRHTSILGDVSDETNLIHLFERHRPDIVLHAAAYKHVPLMELNPFAAMANNAVGTYTLAKTAASFGTSLFLLISTDKAADPASVMGASKRIAEVVVLSMMEEYASMKSTALRLGNVLGSDGSVLPLFLDQIAAGVSLTVTHPDAMRYLMTMQQVVESVFGALDLRQNQALLVPELGEQRSILDLARHLQKQHPNSSQIRFTELRPGDKLEESLLSKSESWGETPGSVSRLLRVVIGPRPSFRAAESAIAELSRAITLRDIHLLLKVVATLVPEYRPSALVESYRHPLLSANVRDGVLEPVDQGFA